MPADFRRESVHTLPAFLVRAAARGERPDDLPGLAAWLAQRDDDLDIRSFWLAHVALAALAGGDPLGLARARDRALAKLVGGLSLARDLPAALRAEAASDPRAQADLEELLARVGDAERDRRRSAVEAPVAYTRAYVELTVAWGLARAGGAARARALARDAVAGLPAGDPVHGALAGAYVARLEGAIAGEPDGAPLPIRVAEPIDALDGLLRYKVDRLRQGSPVLAPRERLDPIRGFHDPRSGGADLLADLPLESEAAVVARLEAELPGIARLPAGPRARALEKALAVAGAFGRADLALRLVEALREALASLAPDDVAPLARGLRGLRRLGLAAEASALLATLAERDPSVATRLELAGSLCALGRSDEAEPHFAAARAALPSLLPADRPAVLRAFGDAAGQAPRDRARPLLVFLESQHRGTTDSFNTNSHFCLSVIQLVEALVVGHLGSLTRAHLDDDELAVRTRIQADWAG